MKFLYVHVCVCVFQAFKLISTKPGFVTAPHSLNIDEENKLGSGGEITVLKWWCSVCVCVCVI